MLNCTEYANNLFEQPWWLDIVARDYWKEYVSKDDKGNIVGRMPVICDKKRIYLPEMTQTVGIWMTPEASKDYGMQKRIINDLLGQIPKKKNMQFVLAPENQYILPFRWAGYSFEPRFTYRINDLSDIDTLYNKLNKTAKKNIKTARNKVKIVDILDECVLFDLMDKTFEVQGRKNPMSKKLISRILKECNEKNCGKYLAAVDLEGNVHSCAYFVYDKQVCYYLLGASDSKFRSSGAQSLVIWEGIKFASAHSKIFDFEGSMVEGIENFFRQFSTECVPYFVINKQTLFGDILDILKPYIKRMLNYKI